ncbi:TonB family protein [Mesorhizobium sp. SP-1A]|uniref:energy transducer TonB family protein n=1 Tax=Mesorhizobium sp. SP-1A TaxID=3077840 RepID=UPI0028F6FCB3|nr:TonB family protein [Mesorhizobium sp. SP-1A]
MRHPEPAFAAHGRTWPLAGLGALPAERDDPALAIPRGAVQFSARDAALRGFMAEIGPAPALAPVATPADEKARAAERKRRWTPAILVSCLLHLAAAAALVAMPFSMPLTSEQIESGDQSGILMTGNSTENSTAAGSISDTDVTKVTLVPMVDAKPVQTVDAQPVTTAEATEPVQKTAPVAPSAEAVQPAETETQPPAAPETAEPVSNAPVPQILAAPPLSPAENDIVQPAAEAQKPDQAEAVVTAKEVPQPKPQEKQAQPPKPATKEKPVNKADAPQKQQPKPKKAKTQPGSGGQADSDSKRGVSDGRDDGDTALASKGGHGEGGNAAVSNYPGKVAARLRRVARTISSSARAKAQGNAQVAFLVKTNGSIGAVELVRSSGSPELDKAALAMVRRAAPFPPIPPEAGRSSWAFTLPIGPF